MSEMRDVTALKLRKIVLEVETQVADRWYKTPFWEWVMCPPWGFLDGIGHALRLPKRLQRPLCDRFDLALGCPDTPENFPDRWSNRA